MNAHVRRHERLLRFALEHLLMLPLGALIALAWVNTAPESYYQFALAAAFTVNDLAMVFFFGIIMKEVVEATVPGGVLHPRRRVWLPIVASAGVAGVPALLFILLVDTLDEPMLALAWPVTFATDLAVGYFVTRLIFGGRHPVIPFFLLIGIASNAFGFLATAAFHPARDLHLGVGALAMALALCIAGALRRAVCVVSGRTCSAPAARRGVRYSWVDSIPRLLWFRSCPFCRTRNATLGFLSTRPLMPPMR